MNRPVCCCSETCPVHCLVPSPAGESHPAHGQEGRGPAGLERERVGGGVLQPDHLSHGCSPRGGDLVQHARSGHTLVTRGEGGDLGFSVGGLGAPLFCIF